MLTHESFAWFDFLNCLKKATFTANLHYAMDVLSPDIRIGYTLYERLASAAQAHLQMRRLSGPLGQGQGGQCAQRGPGAKSATV